MSNRLEQPLAILAFATFLMLLLACLNVANLSLARVLAQRRTIALKVALGASRARVVGEQLVESALLAALGGTVGVALAPRMVQAMLPFLPSQRISGLGLHPDVDGRILALSLGVGVVATLISGIAPAVSAASVLPVNALKARAQSIAAGLGTRRALVVSQFALALVLLMGAGLFGRTLASLRARGPGFSTSNLMMFRLTPLLDGYDATSAKALLRGLQSELEALPEIDRVGLSQWQILVRGGWGNPVTIESNRRRATERAIRMNAVSPDFFETLGAAVVSGRGFVPSDARPDSEWGLRSAVVNQAFARRYSPDASPLGSRLGIGARPDTVADIDVVGVVSDFHSDDLRQAEPQVFFALWERDVTAATFYVRSRSSVDRAAASIRAALRRIDSSLTVLSLRTLDDQLDRSLRSERMLSTLAAIFSAVASLLAMVGLYGVLVFSAAQRTKEIGIRIALGAPRWSASGLILREALRMAMAGLALAAFPTWLLGRLIANQLFAVGPLDPLTFASSASMLVGVCLVASLLASRKAGSVNPLTALRMD